MIFNGLLSIYVFLGYIYISSNGNIMGISCKHGKHIGVYPLVIKHGLLENPSFIDNFPARSRGFQLPRLAEGMDKNEVQSSKMNRQQIRCVLWLYIKIYIYIQ
jgi:hypothetical protein